MIEKLLSRLEKVKRTGPGRYVACCPAHNDRLPSLSLSEKNGSVLFHCFAGCAPADVLAAVGLEFHDLYPEKLKYSKGSKAPFNAHDVLKCLQFETLVVAIVAAQIIDGEPLNEEDAERVIQSHERVYEACKLAGVRL